MSKNWGSNRRTFGDLEGATSAASGLAIDEKPERREIRKRFKSLAANFGRRIIPEMELTWIDKLEPFAGLKLYAALDKALEEERMPTLGRILEMFRGRRDTEPFKSAPELTPEHRRRSSHSAVMSMLWMRYNFPDSTHSQLGLDVLKGLFPGDAGKALAAAQEIYPREMVDRWMRDQVAAGN